MPKKPEEPPHGRTILYRPRGKPVYCVNDANGQPVQSSKPIAYLGWDKATARFYVVPSKPKVYLGRDLNEAIWRFRQWVLDEDAEAVEYTERWIPRGKPKEHLRKLGIKGDEFDVKQEFPEAEAWSFVRRQILDSPTLAAKKLAIPEVARLASLPKPQPTISLDACLQHYVAKRKKISSEEQKKTAAAWKLFAKHVQPATKLGDVTTELFDGWVDAIYLPFDDGGSARTLHHKVQRITKVLNHVLHKQDLDRVNCKRLLALIRRIELPEAEGYNPDPLSLEEWRSLARAAKRSRWEPILYTMLNCCFYGCDIRRLPVSTIDLDRATVVFDRSKRQTPRVAVLWSRTVNLLRSWMGQNPSETTVFLTQYRTPYTAQGLRNAFRMFRAKAKLPSAITLNRLRDSAYTAAIQGGADTTHANILAGHRIPGMTDAYVRRNPMMVEDACEAIRKTYRIR